VKSPRIDYVWVGGFVIAMVVALVVCLAMLSGRTGARDTYYTHFDNVLGVIPGTQLFYEGYGVGRVESIEPSHDPSKGRYRVTLSVQRGWPIPEDSVAWITEPSLLAAITIDIHAGKSKTLLQPGDDLTGRDLASVFTAVGTLAEQVEYMIKHDIRPLLDSVATVSPRILGNLDSVTDDLAAVTAEVKTLMRPENEKQLEKMIDDFALTAENLGELSAALDESLKRVDEMVTNVDDVVSGNKEEFQQMILDLRYTLDSIARRVDTITANLESTSHNANEFTREIRENPSVLVRGTRDGGDGP
jgi:phospholipid/cholesterol/gamma-HCH transport system substrate-binding protein